MNHHQSAETYRTHDDVLEAVAEAIDIPEYLDQVARDSYRALGDWLDRDDSGIKIYDPQITPQGSFLLGTVVKPLSNEDQYDLDLVCTLQATKQDFTMRRLKQAVGEEIRAYAAKHGMKKVPTEKRRCWELEYAGEAQFHVDVLPAVPDGSDFRRALEAQGHHITAGHVALFEGAIAITDNTHPGYERITAKWPVSNPSGYALWFRSMQADALRQVKKEYLRSDVVYASIDDIPDYIVKTPLQRSIQLLKRHRDSLFATDGEHKPISIIITTLAAHAYNGEHSITEALRTVLREMDTYIEVRGGATWIANPSNPEENFADKWAETPKKEESFQRWLAAARRNFGEYISARQFSRMPAELGTAFGSRVMAEVRRGLRLSTPAVVGSAIAAAEVAKIQEAGTATKPWYAHGPID